MMVTSIAVTIIKGYLHHHKPLGISRPFWYGEERTMNKQPGDPASLVLTSRFLQLGVFFFKPSHLKEGHFWGKSFIYKSNLEQSDAIADAGTATAPL